MDENEDGGFQLGELEQEGIFEGLEDHFKLDDSLRDDFDEQSSRASKKGEAAQIFERNQNQNYQKFFAKLTGRQTDTNPSARENLQTEIEET